MAYLTVCRAVLDSVVIYTKKSIDESNLAAKGSVTGISPTGHFSTYNKFRFRLYFMISF